MSRRIGNGKGGKGYQLVRKRVEHQSRSYVEERVNNGDACHSGLLVHNREVQEGVQGVEDYHEQCRSNHVEVQVNHRRAAGSTVGSDGRNDGGDAGTDVLAHDDGDGCRIWHNARQTEGLKDTD